jgi:hypothetical protein
MARSTLAELPTTIQRAGIQPPALFAIGPAVGHADRLDWFGTRPLLGQRVLVPAPAGELTEVLELAGVEVVEAPLPLTPAAHVVIGALPLTGCVLRSADDVDGLEDERDGDGWGPGVVAWCFGAATAARARELGWREVVELPETATADDLANAMTARG